MIPRRTLLVVTGASLLAVPPLRVHRAEVPTAVVRAGALEDTFVESGTLTAAHMRLYSAATGVPPQKIIELVPEGTTVKPGDRLIRFDATQLERDLARQEAVLQEARADQLRARDEFRVEQLRAESDAQEAHDRVDFAERTVANQVDGRGRVDLTEANAAAADTAREATRARKSFEDLKPLLASGFITRSELERAEQVAVHAESAAKLANMRAQAIADFERPAAIAKARAELSTARDAIMRQRETAVARLQQAQAAAALADARVADAQARIDMLRAQIAGAVVAADGPGIVIYREAYFGGERRKPQVGDDVSPNQPVVAVPDASRMIVETRVREIDVGRVAAGEHVGVFVDAFPDVRVSATVTLVGALALEDGTRVGTRFFPVTAVIDKPLSQMRPGMTARVEFASPATRDAPIVPLTAIFDADGDAYCVVMDGERAVRRPVSVIARTVNEASVRGLRAGQRVALVDPDASR